MSWRHSRCVPDPVRVIQAGMNVPPDLTENGTKAPTSLWLSSSAARRLQFITEIFRLDFCNGRNTVDEFATVSKLNTDDKYEVFTYIVNRDQLIARPC